MSRFPEPLTLFGLAAAGTGALLGSALLVANALHDPGPDPAEFPPLSGAAWAQDAAGAPAERQEDVASADMTASPLPAENPAPSREGGYGLGREALPEEIAAWDIDVRPDGQGLPPGSGDVMTGEALFVERCATCHGDFGEGAGRWPQLAGGFGTLDSDDPVKTVGSFWPYLSTAIDYIHRAMPFGDAQSLTADETYAITAYILYLNDLVDEDFVLSPETFASVRMPNAEGFFDDDRDVTELALFSGEPCMEACKDSVEITMRATVLDVTPDDGLAPAEATAGGAEASAAAEAAPATEPATEPAAEPAAEAAPEPVAEPPSVEADAPASAPDMALVAAGEQVFRRRCASCHEVGEGARTRTGPVLNGVVGRPIASAEGFGYSRVLEDAGAAGRVWSVEELAAYLADPRGAMPGTRMAFQGLRSEEEIAAVIAFLQSHPE